MVAQRMQLGCVAVQMRKLDMNHASTSSIRNMACRFVVLFSLITLHEGSSSMNSVFALG